MMSSLGRLPGGLPTALAILACIIAPMCCGLAGVYIKGKASGVKPMAIAGGRASFSGGSP
ncbi:MAG: hypothetical protein IMZ69_04315 [Spirochaetes bacterium]|nr:hypothetical protein [Spirochaetota bacterium]